MGGRGVSVSSCGHQTWNVLAGVVELEGEIVALLESRRRAAAKAYLEASRSSPPRVVWLFITEALFQQATGFEAEESSRLWARWLNGVDVARRWMGDGEVRISVALDDLVHH